MLIKYDPDGNQVWERIKSSGVSGIEFPRQALVYKDSLILLMGYTANIGQTLTVYTLAYDVSGSLKWIAPPVNGVPHEMAVDGDGYVYIAGDNGTSPVQGISVKYGPEGQHLWTRTLGDNPNLSIAVDYDHNVYTTGADVLVKYDFTGILQWQQPLTHPISLYQDTNRQMWRHLSWHIPRRHEF